MFLEGKSVDATKLSGVAIGWQCVIGPGGVITTTSIHWSNPPPTVDKIMCLPFRRPGTDKHAPSIFDELDGVWCIVQVEDEMLWCVVVGEREGLLD